MQARELLRSGATLWRNVAAGMGDAHTGFPPLPVTSHCTVRPHAHRLAYSLLRCTHEAGKGEHEQWYGADRIHMADRM